MLEIKDLNVFYGAIHALKDQKKVSGNLEKVYAHFPRLKERYKQLAGTLSGGEQQMLAADDRVRKAYLGA